ncbi:MAG: CRISPR-associated endonuclease Cas2 [Sedimenticola sp.]|nr:MAG: CRISPR-associated endonuclease Cas2 [Sedimenticola sp.]
MESTTLYLAAYDIRNPRRLRKGLEVLRDYALGRQKSVFECPLEGNEPAQLLARMEQVIKPDEDRFALVRLDRRCATHTLGRGVSIELDNIFYIG